MIPHKMIAGTESIFMPDKGARKCSPQLPLPGVVILVHGVNSDGEWFEATEQGLCSGLNTRLARQEKQMCVKGVAGGQLTPASYTPELTEKGFLNPDRNAQTFISEEPNYSPVIRFRWGYKADDRSLKDYGANVWLNENNYWGGGPFANGCTALADLWSEGINDRLFLWITAQHLNPEPGRDVYACPPRHYYALAAKRLAELIRLIRQKQADVPITIVCHSQGNMIGLGAAFYGAQIGEVTDGEGRSAPAVADNYVLANPPYSLLESNGTDNWSQRYTINSDGQSGRETGRARHETLANFFKHIRSRQGCDQDAGKLQMRIGNANPADGSSGFLVAEDRKVNAAKGRVTLYCNPHDRVISALTVQGIGWRGLSQQEINSTGAAGVFVQRVWAQGNPVGRQGPYRYWDGKVAFWRPESRPARFSLSQGLESNQSVAGKIVTMVTAPFVLLLVKLGELFKATKINALPPDGWTVPVNAPSLPVEHLPQAQRLGQPTAFDQEMDPDTDLLRSKTSVEGLSANDPYDQARPEHKDGVADDDWLSEARLRYEHRARLRMKASRQGMDSNQANVPDEDANPEWIEWSREQVTNFLKESIDQHATDHSTIMTCAANLEKVLAYDVPVGLSELTNADWSELKIAADWQLWEGLGESHPHKEFGIYFDTGLWKENRPLHEHPAFQMTARPLGIVDERTNRATPLFKEGA